MKKNIWLPIKKKFRRAVRRADKMYSRKHKRGYDSDERNNSYERKKQRRYINHPKYSKERKDDIARLEQKKDNYISEIKRETDDLVDAIDELERELSMIRQKVSEKKRAIRMLQHEKEDIWNDYECPLRDIILQHEPHSHGSSFSKYTVLRLMPYNDSWNRSKGPEIWKQLGYLFPYKEKGYTGKPGICTLAGHVTFSTDDWNILQRYYVYVEHVTYDQFARGNEYTIKKLK